MSEDRKIIIKARNLVKDMMIDPSPDKCRMALWAVEELCQAYEEVTIQLQRAKATVQDVIKDSQEARR